jgi:hypothetical protein
VVLRLGTLRDRMDSPVHRPRLRRQTTRILQRLAIPLRRRPLVVGQDQRKGLIDTAMGRKTLLWGLISGGIGFATAMIALSMNRGSHLAPLLAFILCPAGLLGSLTPTANPDTGFLWLVKIVNAVIYGLIGVTCAMFFRVDDN